MTTEFALLSSESLNESSLGSNFECYQTKTLFEQLEESAREHSV